MATKFEEMRESVSQAVKKWEEYHHQCIRCDEFYESIVEKVKQFFTTRLEETLDKQPSTVRIGFL